MACLWTDVAQRHFNMHQKHSNCLNKIIKIFETWDIKEIKHHKIYKINVYVFIVKYRNNSDFSSKK